MKDQLQPLDMSFPLAGLDVTGTYFKQPPRQIGEGVWARSCPVGTNVRGYEPGTDRLRGGSRPGLLRYINAIPGGVAGQIQCLEMVVGVGYSSPAGSAQASQSGRVVNLLAVVGGNVYVGDAGGTTWTTAINGSSAVTPLNPTGVIRSFVMNGRAYFFDGTNCRYYSPSTNTVGDWLANQGLFPKSTLGLPFPRLGCLYRGRAVVAGLQSDPQNIYFSKQGDATDFQYAPLSPTATQAAAGNLTTMGLIGDLVNGITAFSDDVLLVFGDSTLYQVKGDPVQGGQAQVYTRGIGCAYGNAFCTDPALRVYFFSNNCGVYVVEPGKQPVPISDKIYSLLRQVDTGSNEIRLAWNHQMNGLHVFITPASAAAAATHYFWEARSGAWWKDTFANNNHNPCCALTFDGNLPADRVTLIGSWDGYVRSLSNSATTDDGTNIAGEVWIGPIQSDDMAEWLLANLQADMGNGSGSVSWAVHVGRTAELALASTAVRSGTFAADRSLTYPVDRAGRAIYVKITSTTRWAMERVRAYTRGLGRIRQLQKY